MFMTEKNEFQKPDPFTPTDYNNDCKPCRDEWLDQESRMTRCVTLQGDC